MAWRRTHCVTNRHLATDGHGGELWLQHDSGLAQRLCRTPTQGCGTGVVRNLAVF